MATSTLMHPRIARVERPRALLIGAIVIGWVPLVLIGIVERVLGQVEPVVADASVHVRLVVAVPLFLVADLALAFQENLTLTRLGNEGFIVAADRARFDALVRRTEALRSSLLPELVLLALAIVDGVATLLGWRGPTGAIPGSSPSGGGVARAWFALVGLPLFLFLLLRSLWRWGIWVVTLLKLARLRLALALGHPDRRGGISFLTLPSMAFNAPFLLGVSSVLCASWGMRVSAENATLKQFMQPMIAFALLGVLLAFAPLLVFSPRLFLGARAGVVEYGRLATDYVRRFRTRWMAPAPHDELLGTSDIQSLNDLGGQYRESVEKTIALVFTPRDVVALALVMALPVLPLSLTVVPVAMLLGKVVQLLVSGH
jgi:hypothetical protein